MKTYINKWTLEQVQSHLNKTTGSDFQVTSFESAGEGNMNYAFRVNGPNGESVIMKQSPPYCAKFPSIPAPEQRINSELKYYQQINKTENLQTFSPKILGFDQDQLILYMSDLGRGTDFENLYSGEILSKEDLAKLISYLRDLHGIKIPRESEFKNTQMRKLNSDYIFDLPFDQLNTSINLDEVTPGLKDICSIYKKDKELNKRVKQLKELYWRETQTLIHGDYYPRSWLKTQKGLFVIDPEFAFYGIAEFDLSVFIAHLEMCSQGETVFNALCTSYGPFDQNLTLKLAAVEVFRRIMFVSQLPLADDLPFKESLLKRSYETIMGDNPMAFFGEKK